MKKGGRLSEEIREKEGMVFAEEMGEEEWAVVVHEWQEMMVDLSLN